MRSAPLACLVFLAILVAIPTGGRAQSAPQSHLDLDWTAPNRWVHVDNVDAKDAALFVNARLGWLRTLRRGDSLLGDGRPLFWNARRSPAGETFFTFYPWRVWADLDTRAEMIKRTQGIVGDEAVKAYDSGDAALVSPHYSQIWRRAPDLDIATAANGALTELTAAAGRIEVHSIDIRRWDEFERAWGQLRDALVAGGYPLACRVFKNSYGRGEYVVWWLAPDSTVYAGAPPLRAALERQAGAPKCAEILAVLDAAFPVVEQYEVERRADMSNLGR